MLTDPVTGFFILTLLLGIALVACILRRPVPRPKTYEPLSHVNLAGVTRRCARCRRVRQTMPYADGLDAPAEPHCGPCLRDLVDVDHGEGEASA